MVEPTTEDEERLFQGRFFNWTPNDGPGLVIDTSTDTGWAELTQRLQRYYEGPAYPQGKQVPTLERSRPFARILDLARDHDTLTVVVEHRYIDADFRSEYAEFYAGMFRRFPSVCLRLHFFTETFTELTDIGAHTSSYVGYTVLRPLERAPVGRTMLALPATLKADAMCLAEEPVNLFGWGLRVRGMPFISQDRQFMRCAHAVQWMVLRHASLRGELPRRFPPEIQASSTGGMVLGRQLPSAGLSAAQMLESLRKLGVSATRIRLPDSRAASESENHLSLYARLCRYVNSQMPPIVLLPGHVQVVVGYRYGTPVPRHDQITLFVHDDEVGPYVEIADPWAWKWAHAIPPLPPKCSIDADNAEILGRECFERLRYAAETEPDSPPVALREVMTTRAHYRTYGIPSTAFKSQLADRDMPEELSDNLYRFAHLPRHLWVVELHDEELMEQGVASTLGEVIIDPTAHQFADADDPCVLAVHAMGSVMIRTPDHERIRTLTLKEFTPYRTGCAALRQEPPASAEQPASAPGPAAAGAESADEA